MIHSIELRRGYSLEIVIIAVGRMKERYLAEGIREYMKRLRPYVNLLIHEVADEHLQKGPAPGAELISKTREGRRLLEALPENAILVALDPEGEEWPSRELAARLNEWELQGRGRIAFAIGGELGLSEEVLVRADQVLSLSRMTFPYQIARLLLLEQIYRAFRINRGEPYHR
ncbi:MAG: 23S rRNA (pseudouridine(1915)-N(3))-methyltransferase RlmH [Methanomicrobiales archaeon]|nr:23S rRNA (pseudouridine(1915)-N(3))-methyltransferase RlmH [Methanomicrobiales archaeon]